MLGFIYIIWFGVFGKTAPELVAFLLGPEYVDASMFGFGNLIIPMLYSGVIGVILTVLVFIGFLIKKGERTQGVVLAIMFSICVYYVGLKITHEPVSVLSIESTFNEIYFEEVGDSLELSLYANYSDGRREYLHDHYWVYFQSSNERIAIVNTTGVITAVGPGKAIVTSTFQKKSVDSNVYVPFK